MKKSYIISSVSVLAVAALGTVFTVFGMEWFGELIKPSQWVPSFVFPLVWSVIYISFAIVLYLWQKKKPLSARIKILLGANGFLNVLWCLVFFTCKSLIWGDIVIVINALLAIALTVEIFKESAVYGLWLGIYPVWLCLATTLNIAVWILN